MRSVEFLFVGNGMVFVPFCADSSGSGNRSLPDFLLSGARFLINVKTHPSQKACGGGGEGISCRKTGTFFLENVRTFHGKCRDIPWKTFRRSMKNVLTFHFTGEMARFSCWKPCPEGCFLGVSITCK